MKIDQAIRELQRQHQANRRLLQLILFIVLLWTATNLLALIIVLGWIG